MLFQYPVPLSQYQYDLLVTDVVAETRSDSTQPYPHVALVTLGCRAARFLP